jgi:hypothetical protein
MAYCRFCCISSALPTQWREIFFSPRDTSSLRAEREKIKETKTNIWVYSISNVFLQNPGPPGLSK